MNINISLVGVFLVFIWNIIIMERLSEPKYSRKVMRAIWSCCTIVLLLTSYILMYTVGVDKTALILGVVSMIVLIIVLFIVSTDCVPKKFFLVLTYFSYFFLATQGAFTVSGLIFEQGTDAYQIFSVILRNIINIILVPLYFKFLHPKFRKVRVRRNSEWWFLDIISALAIFVYMSQAMVVNRMWNLPSEYLPVLTGIFIQSIATYLVVFRTILYMDKTAEASLMEQNTVFLTEQIERLVRAEEEARRLRHDIRHHITNIYECAKSGDCETLLRYLDEYDLDISETAVRSFCLNRTVNNILSAYAGKAEKAGIEFVCEAKAADLPVKDNDIVAILANLLENAINGCKESKAEEPRIKVFIREKNGKLIIVCNNNCAERLMLSDNLPKNKGIGISSIVSSCEKYGGKIDYTVKDGVCSVCVVLEI